MVVVGAVAGAAGKGVVFLVVAGELGAASELVAGLSVASEPMEQFAAHGRQEVVPPSRGALMVDVFLQTVMDRSVVAALGDVGRDMRARVQALAEVLADPEIGPHMAGLIGEAQTSTDLARQLDDRFAPPVRAALCDRLLEAQRQGQLGPGLDLDVLADTLFAPIWFRRLVTVIRSPPRTPMPSSTRRWADRISEQTPGRGAGGRARARSRPQPRRVRPRRAAKHIDMLTTPTRPMARAALPSVSHLHPLVTSER